jgi:hypothetical protein
LDISSFIHCRKPVWRWKFGENGNVTKILYRSIERNEIFRYFCFQKNQSVDLINVATYRFPRVRRMYTSMCMLPSIPLVCARLLPKFSSGIPGGITVKVYTLLFTFRAQSISAYTHTFSPTPRSTSLSEMDLVDVYFTQENVGLSVWPSGAARWGRFPL